MSLVGQRIKPDVQFMERYGALKVLLINRIRSTLEEQPSKLLCLS